MQSPMRDSQIEEPDSEPGSEWDMSYFGIEEALIDDLPAQGLPLPWLAVRAVRFAVSSTSWVLGRDWGNGSLPWSLYDSYNSP